MKFLTTGTRSGLGKYLFEAFGGLSYTRETSSEVLDKLKKEDIDIIIHAAFNSSRNITSNNLYSYIGDNVLLTKKLLKTPHKKFIYISTVDVYPEDNKKHTENQVIDIYSISTLYSITKLMSESLVKNLSPNFLLLRCATLLGKNSRENSLIKIIKDKNPALTLSSDSTFNYILHKDVLEFIKLAIEEDLQGIYNLASSENIMLKDIAALIKKHVNFGTYIYNVGNIDNTKATTIFHAFKKTSKEVVGEIKNIIG